MKKWILFLYFAKQGLMKKRFKEINEKAILNKMRSLEHE